MGEMDQQRRADAYEAWIKDLRLQITTQERAEIISELQAEAYRQVIDNWLRPPNPEFFAYSSYTVPLAIQMLAAQFEVITPREMTRQEGT